MNRENINNLKQYMNSNLFQLDDQQFQNPFMIENDNLIEDNLVPRCFEDSKPKAEALINYGENDVYKFDRIYDCNDMEEANFKLKNKESRNEILTKIPTDGTTEEFLRYLDFNFKSEINLCNDRFELFKFSKSSKVLKSADLGIQEVNLTYRGQKNMFTKGVNAERRDVLYKSLIRATRRYLWAMFENEFDIFQIPANKPSDLYKQNVRSLYEKFFRSFTSDEIISNEEKEEEICFVIATILSNKYSFPNKTEKHRRFIAQFEDVYRKFSKSTYEKFLGINNISNVFEMFLKSGINESLFFK